MKHRFLALTFILMVSLACSLGGIGNSQETVEEPAKESQNRCGDDVCDGPEDTQNCPEDCETGMLVIGPKEDEESPVSNNGGGSKQFRISMTINAESNLMGVAGSDAQSYYEPVMVGFVEIEAVFPENGGSATSQKGTITLTDYHGKGPYCSVEVEDGMIGSTSEFVFSDISWDPAGRMNFTADVTYESKAYNTFWSCPPKPAVSIEEYPMYKMAGIFNEEMRTLSIMIDQGFAVQEMLWGPNEVFPTTLDIVVEEIN
ncbi:MAG: hypothetical protein K8R77_03990 [Anaerolineaceae bacterium]|nr:hypothetical protein [Anaerolineaceae bacterium]